MLSGASSALFNAILLELFGLLILSNLTLVGILKCSQIMPFFSHVSDLTQELDGDTKSHTSLEYTRRCCPCHTSNYHLLELEFKHLQTLESMCASRTWSAVGASYPGANTITEANQS